MGCSDIIAIVDIALNLIVTIVFGVWIANAIMKANTKERFLKEYFTNELNDIKYYNLLLDQLSWLNEHYIQVKNKSKRLYKLYTSRKLSKVVFDRCCDFTLLEEKCRKYNKEMILA